MEYRKAIYERYHRAGRKDKGKILKEFCASCGYNRKYAIRVLNGPSPMNKNASRRKRVCRYQDKTVEVAAAIWEASGHLCSERLKEALPLWLPAAKKRFAITPQIERQLTCISARQLENRLRPRKRWLKKRLYSTTKPGRLLKSMIPVRTSNWDIRMPGYLEIDLVAHCGGSLAGQFVYTLNSTDIQTGWVERRAVLGKGKVGILNAVFDIRSALPFRLRGIDSDNGEEFINYQLLDFCVKSRPQIKFTRGRPYKKNDNAYIEQKNDTHVRQLLGWDRYDNQEAIDAINDLYENEQRLFDNLFKPSMKLIEKTRVGSKVVRHYDKAKTPFKRLLESRSYHKGKMGRLKGLVASLDPFTLSAIIDRKLNRIYAMSTERIRAQNTDTVASKEAVKAVAQDKTKRALDLEVAKIKFNYGFGRRYARQRRIMRDIKREKLLASL